ncbi:MAG: hypothetical protein ACI9EF_002350 [Pseudohongiellaceae bacterium]|jgi:hypothetical protein
MSAGHPQHFTVRTWQPGDEAALLSLHNSAYTGHPDRAMAHWHWKHHANPLGRVEIVLATNDEGRYLVVYSGVIFPAILDGEDCHVGVHLDVAVETNLRQGIGASRPLIATMRRFVHEYGGGETPFAWGFPEPPLQRIGQRFAMLQVLRDVVFLVRAVHPAPSPGTQPSTVSGSVTVRAIHRYDGDADALWQQCRGDIGTGVRRDACYLNWRYADHPDVQYTLLEARDEHSNTLRGIAVFRGGGWDPTCLSVLDWLVPNDDMETEATLLEHLDDAASALGKTWLVTWVTGSPDRFQRFQREHRFFAQLTPYQVSFKSWPSFARRRWLAEHWYQTMGDIDFF